MRTRHAPACSARLLGLTPPTHPRLPSQRLLETAPLQCDLAVLDECAAATIKMVQAATPLPPLPPPPPHVGVPARALATPTAEEGAVKALVAAARFACLQFVQRHHSDGGPQWQRLSELLKLVSPPASESRAVGACVHPVPSAAASYALDARLGKLRAEMVVFLRRPRGEPATQAAVVPHLDDYEARRKLLIAALGAAAERWTPPTRCRGSGGSALPPPLPVLGRVMLASSGSAQAATALAISVIEQQQQRMAALSPPESDEVEAVEETMEPEQAEEEAAEEEAAEEEAAEEEAAEEEAAVEARPAEGAAGVEMDNELLARPRPSPVTKQQPRMTNDKRRAASGVLATSLDGAAWKRASQQGAGGEKRQRASPISFTAGPAPPPSVLHDEARRAQVAAAVASSDPAPARKQQSRDPATPMPQLLGTQVRVLWGDEWYQGVGGDSKLEDGVWITRVAYDANGTWRKCSMWHNLANEAWEQM